MRYYEDDDEIEVFEPERNPGVTAFEEAYFAGYGQGVADALVDEGEAKQRRSRAKKQSGAKAKAARAKLSPAQRETVRSFMKYK